jgi:sterol desaturase/sphingolipid hydroxylase (fatty acid hydroxylase superfamily)
MALWEMLAPRRRRLFSRRQRWPGNLGIVALNSALLWLLFPVAAVGFAAFARGQGWGMLNYLPLPFWLEVVLALVLLDLVIYLQHVMMHAVPLLWRLHRLHHADPDYDLTTGARFHPLEIILSMALKLAAVAALGPPVLAVVLFEVLLNAMAMFNHGNVGLPARLDRVLRWLLVTPDMHRVHHSQEVDETNSNFGFNLSLWDRLLGTYREQPRLGQLGMQIGISSLHDPRITTRLGGMLLIPLIRTPRERYAINQREWDGNPREGDTKT